MNRKKVKGLFARKSGIYYADTIINGKRLTKSLGTKDYAEAVYKLGKLKSEHIEQSLDMFSGFDDPFAEECPTLSVALERAMEERFKDYADSKTARAHILTIIKIIGDIKLDQISAKHINKIRNTLKKQGKVEGTINRYMGKLSVILHLARDEWEVVTDIPKIPKYKETGKRHYILTPETEKRLLEWLYKQKNAHPKKTSKEGWEYAELAMVLIDTGLRLSEGLTLEVQDVGETMLTVRAVNAKNGKSRVVPLSKDAKEILMRRVKSAGGKPRACLFNGMGKWAALDRMRKAKAALGLSHTDLGWHTLRHTCATRLLKAGTDIVTVQTWLGHHDIKTTRRYLHYIEGSMEKALTNVSKMFTRETIARA